MGEAVTFGGVRGYRAGDGNGAVVVLHEWDGLTPHIRDVTDRMASRASPTVLPSDSQAGPSAL